MFHTPARRDTNATAKTTKLFVLFYYACSFNHPQVLKKNIYIYIQYHKCTKICTRTEITSQTKIISKNLERKQYLQANMGTIYYLLSHEKLHRAGVHEFEGSYFHNLSISPQNVVTSTLVNHFCNKFG